MGKKRAEVETVFTAKDKASATSKKVKDNIVGDAKSIAAGFVAATASVAAFKAGIIDSLKASAEHEQVMRRLELSGIRNAAAIDRQAEALQRLSGVSSDTIENQIAITRSLSASDEMAVKFARAALEASAALSKDFAPIAEQLNQTLSGTAGSLARTIAPMRDLTAEELRAGEGAQLLIDMFGGSAAAQGKTLAGSMAILKESVGDLKQSFGDFLVASTAPQGGLKTLTDLVDKYAAAVARAAQKQKEMGPSGFLLLGKRLVTPGAGDVSHPVQNDSFLRIFQDFVDAVGDLDELLARKLANPANGPVDAITGASVRVGGGRGSGIFGPPLSTEFSDTMTRANMTRDLIGFGRGGPQHPEVGIDPETVRRIGEEVALAIRTSSGAARGISLRGKAQAFAAGGVDQLDIDHTRAVEKSLEDTQRSYEGAAFAAQTLSDVLNGGIQDAIFQAETFGRTLQRILANLSASLIQQGAETIITHAFHIPALGTNAEIVPVGGGTSPEFQALVRRHIAPEVNRQNARGQVRRF